MKNIFSVGITARVGISCLVCCAVLFVPQMAGASEPPFDIKQPAVASEIPYIFNITYEDAEEEIGKSLSEKSDGKTVTATISGKKSTPLYSYNKPVSVEIRGLRPDSNTSRWSANLVIISDDKVISAMPISGKYTLVTEVPVLKHALKNGELISKEDIEMKKVEEARVYKDTVTELESLVGQSPVRVISPNRPIRSNEISAPAVVKKNSLVQMRYKTANMEISTTGQAMSDGAKGDVIEVKNTTSKKIARGVVSGTGTVDVMAQGVQTSQVEN